MRVKSAILLFLPETRLGISGEMSFSYFNCFNPADQHLQTVQNQMRQLNLHCLPVSFGFLNDSPLSAKMDMSKIKDRGAYFRNTGLKELRTF